MSTIEELRQRVEAAERRFGLIDEQERRYSERLIDLMNTLETAQRQLQTEAASHQTRVAELERENGELRGMLHALLLGVEAGSRETLAGTLRDLDSRLSGLLGGAPGAEETVDAPELSMTAVDGEESVVDVPADADPLAAEIAAEDDAGAAEISAIVEDEIDPVVAAEQAVAALIGAADMAPEAESEDAPAETEMDPEPGTVADAALPEDGEDPDPASPVAEMIERLEEETQYFSESAAAPAEEPAPQPVSARSQA